MGLPQTPVFGDKLQRPRCREGGKHFDQLGQQLLGPRVARSATRVKQKRNQLRRHAGYTGYDAITDIRPQRGGQRPIVSDNLAGIAIEAAQ